MEATLSAHWGDEWEEVRKEIEDWVDLDELRDPPEPWEEVRDAALARLVPGASTRNATLDAYSWPAPIDNEKLRQMHIHLPEDKVLDSISLGELDRIAESYSAQIEEAANIYVDMIQAAVREEIAAGRYRRAPYFLGPNEERQIVHQGISSFGGWSIGYVLTAANYPILAAQKHALDDLKRQRTKAINKHLKDVP